MVSSCLALIVLLTELMTMEENLLSLSPAEECRIQLQQEDKFNHSGPHCDYTPSPYCITTTVSTIQISNVEDITFVSVSAFMKCKGSCYSGACELYWERFPTLHKERGFKLSTMGRDGERFILTVDYQWERKGSRLNSRILKSNGSNL